jgi:hypothetical protein
MKVNAKFVHRNKKTTHAETPASTIEHNQKLLLPGLGWAGLGWAGCCSGSVVVKK